MKYNIIPNTDLNVSKICLGTMTFGEQNTEKEGHHFMDYAVDQGVNIFDTAELYAVPSKKDNNGLTEKYIGTWLSSRGNRRDIIISTKVTGPSRGLKYIREDLSYTPANIRMAVEGSLERLQTDYIDIYQLHWPERVANFFGKRVYVQDPSDQWEDNFLEVITTMNQLIDEGKIRYWGLSNETAWGVMRCLHVADTHNLRKCITVQNPYNLLNRQYEIDLSEISLREDISLLAYSPLAFGLLSGKYHKGLDETGDRLNKYKQMARYNADRTFEAAKNYLSLAESHGLSLTQMALAYINQQEFLASNIIGATTMVQLKENISSIDVDLSKEILKEINEIHELFPDPAP